MSAKIDEAAMNYAVEARKVYWDNQMRSVEFENYFGDIMNAYKDAARWALEEVLKMSKEMFTIEKREGDEAFATVPVKMIHASDIEKLRGK